MQLKYKIGKKKKEKEKWIYNSGRGGYIAN